MRHEKKLPDLFFILKHIEPPIWILASLSLLAGISTWFKTAPPWPTAIGWVTAALVPFLAITLARIKTKLPDFMNRRFVRVALGTATIGSLVYLALYSHYTFTIPTTHEVIVKGFICTPEALMVYPGNCPGNDKEALASAEFESPIIWEQWTIDVVRLALFGAWHVTFMALCWLSASLGPKPFGALINESPPACDGISSYFFVSYAHSDLHQITPILDLLYKNGHKIWFDKGIHGARAWDEQLSLRLRNCTGVIAFLSQNSLNSKWVQREILFADDLGKPVFCVRLSPCELPPPLDLRFIRNQMIEGDPHHVVNQFEMSFDRLAAQDLSVG